MDAAYFLRVQEFAFRLMGFDLWNDSGSKERKDRPLITLLVIGLTTVFLGPLYLAIVHNPTNVSVVSEAMGAVLAIGHTVVKYLIFMRYRKQFVELIYRIRDILDGQIRMLPEAAIIVEQENRSEQKLSRTYVRCFISAGIFAGIKPIVIMVTTRLRSGYWYLELPHSTEYLWDDQAWMPYVPTFMWNLLASYGAVCMPLAMDTLLFAFTYNVCAVFKIAQYRIRHLVPRSEAPGEELLELVQVLHLHQTALSIGTQLAQNLRPLVLMQFFLTSLQLCFVGFELAYSFPTPECIYFVFFISSLLIALFIYSHCGENMKQAGLDFAIAIYDSNWVDFAPATKKALVVAIMRAQRPCQLNGYFFEPNMATFSAVVRSALSYIMMLRSFNATGSS